MNINLAKNTQKTRRPRYQIHTEKEECINKEGRTVSVDVEIWQEIPGKKPKQPATGLTHRQLFRRAILIASAGYRNSI